MQTKNISQKIEFNASAHELFETLIDAKKHSELTGSNVILKREVGEEFSIYDGQIKGKNIEIIPNRKIVQNWWFSYDDWSINEPSVVTFEFIEENGKTTLNFTQTGIPEQHVKELEDGWNEYYWKPMQEMFK